jgi:lipopolysaccharide export system protein LptA
MTLCLPSAATTRAVAQSLDESQFILQSNVREKDPLTGRFTARGNVLFRYPQQQIEGTAEEAHYYREDQKVVLMGNVRLNQRDEVIQNSQVICLLELGRCMPLFRHTIIQ